MKFTLNKSSKASLGSLTETKILLGGKWPMKSNNFKIDWQLKKKSKQSTTWFQWTKQSQNFTNGFACGATTTNSSKELWRLDQAGQKSIRAQRFSTSNGALCLVASNSSSWANMDRKTSWIISSTTAQWRPKISFSTTFPSCLTPST